MATLDDLAAVSVRPNIPGTIDQHPNWRIPLPVPLGELFERTLTRRVLDILAAARSRSPQCCPVPPEAIAA
jgi:4-alpha-glucanotransferase